MATIMSNISNHLTLGISLNRKIFIILYCRKMSCTLFYVCYINNSICNKGTNINTTNNHVTIISTETTKNLILCINDSIKPFLIGYYRVHFMVREVWLSIIFDSCKDSVFCIYYCNDILIIRNIEEAFSYIKVYQPLTIFLWLESFKGFVNT